MSVFCDGWIFLCLTGEFGIDESDGAKGAFITGLVATGAEPDFATAAARLATVGDEFEPDQERAELYSERYERFLALREPAEQSWRALSGD